MSKKGDVVIVGAGVIGCSIAYHLAKKGIASTIIERESIGSRASGKAWAVIEYPAYYLAMASQPNAFWSMPEGETIAHWQDLFWSAYYRMADLALDIKEKGNVDIEYGVAPVTLVAVSEGWEAYIKEILSYMQENGYYEYEWLDSDDVKAIFSSINLEIRGGLSIPQLQVEPYKYTLGLAQAAEAMGVVIRHGDVVGFETKKDRITSIELASGRKIETDIMIMAMGPWSSQAISRLGKEIPMTIALEECLRIKPMKKFPLHSAVGGVEILSRVGGDVILAAAEVHSKAQYFEMKTRHDFDSSLSDEIKTTNIEAAMKLLPELEDSELVEHRGDLLAYGPDPFYHKPVMGRIPGWGNGYVATRFGGLGIHLSVGVGEIMADLIVNDEMPLQAKHIFECLGPS